MNRTKKITFRVTEAEYKNIDKKALQANMTRTRFIIESCKNNPITVISSGTDIVRELHKIGVNLNQLTTLANMGKLKVVGLIQISEAINKLWQSLNL